MFWVLVGSVIDGWSGLDSCTGSTAETRASDRASRTGSLCFDDVEFDDVVPPASGNNVQLIGLLRLVSQLRCRPRRSNHGPREGERSCQKTRAS